MAVLLDRVKETTTTTGTVTIVLGGAVVDFRSFNSSIANGTTVRYGIDDYAGNWELGDGVVGTGTLTRSPIKSSNGNALVNFGVGTKYVYVTAIVNDYLPDQTGNSTKILSTDGTNPSWTPNTVGTVTSVGMSVPSFLSVTPSSITSNGTFTVTLSGTALPVINGGTGVTTSTGSGNTVLSTSPILVTPVLGTPTSGTLSSCTVDGTDAIGFRNIPQNAQTGSYGLVLTDSGNHIYHALAASAATYTIPAATSVAYPIGTAITFINMATAAVTIAITTDTMYLSSAGTTGSRTLAQFGSATAIKISGLSSAGIWIISGSGLT